MPVTTIASAEHARAVVESVAYGAWMKLGGLVAFVAVDECDALAGFETFLAFVATPLELGVAEAEPLSQVCLSLESVSPFPRL